MLAIFVSALLRALGGLSGQLSLGVIDRGRVMGDRAVRLVMTVVSWVVLETKRPISEIARELEVNEGTREPPVVRMKMPTPDHVYTD